MPDLPTSVRKTATGWRGETIKDLGFNIEGHPAELRLTTYANNPGIVSYATVQTRDGGFTTMRVFRDFHERTARDLGTRATEKAIRAAHAALVGQADYWAAAAIDHHRGKGDVA